MAMLIRYTHSPGRVRLGLVLCLLALELNPNAFSAGVTQELLLEDLLKRIENAPQLVRPLTFQSVQEYYGVHSPDSSLPPIPETPNSLTEVTFSRSGNRFVKSVTDSRPSPSGDGFVATSKSVSVWDGESLYGRSGPTRAGFPAQYRDIDEKDLQRFIHHTVGRGPENSYRELSARHLGAFLEGYFALAPMALIDILRSDESAVSLSPDRESVDGFSCYVIEASSPTLGQYKVWVDPDHGYNFRRITVTWDRSFFEERERRASPIVKRMRALERSRNPGLSETVLWECEVKDVVIRQIDGVYIAVAGALYGTVHLADGRAGHGMYLVTRSDIEWDPKLSEVDALLAGWPEGVTVRDMDHWDLEYTWTDGRLSLDPKFVWESLGVKPLEP